MNEYIKKLRVYDDDGNAYDKQIDYNALANLPSSLPANGGVAEEAEYAYWADMAEHDANGQKIVDTYTTSKQVDDKIANLVASAPETLNTLNELAKALGNDPNFATTILESLGKKANIHHTHSAEDLEVSFTPAGTIIWYAAPTPPSGYLVCDGREISKTTYAKLFEVIGDTWGSSSNPNNFILPDLRDEFIRGYNSSTNDRDFGDKQEGTTFITDNDHPIMLLVDNAEELSEYIELGMSNYSHQGNSRPINRIRPNNIALLPCIKY